MRGLRGSAHPISVLSGFGSTLPLPFYADGRLYIPMTHHNGRPTLIMGLEQLLKRVDDLGMADAEELDERINPVNLLGMYLMRNNPKYSNFAEASPYMKSLKAIQDQLKGKVMEASGVINPPPIYFVVFFFTRGH